MKTARLWQSVRTGVSVVLGYVTIQVPPLFFASGLFVLGIEAPGIFFGSLLAFGGLCAVAGGWVTARLGGDWTKGAVYALAAVAAVSWVVWFASASAPNPMWYRLGTAPVMLAGVLIGGLRTAARTGV